jgi:hypothetical protein
MKRRLAGSVILILIVGAAGALGSYFARHHAATHVVSRVTRQVPEAKKLLSFKGTGFARRPAKKGFAASAPKGARRDALAINAPLEASGTFEIGRSKPWRPAGVSLPRSAPVVGHTEAGIVAYPNAYPGIDVVATGDTEHLELGYVVHDASTRTELRLRFEKEAGSLTLDRDRALLRGPDGETRLAIANPIAFDAARQKRAGTYRVEQNDLVIDLDLTGMAAPVFIDPVFFIPVWSIVEDARQPGSEVYNPGTLSRETQVVYDAKREVPVLVRPSHEQQSWSNGFYGVHTRLRNQAATAPAPGEAAVEDWKRIAGSGSEVWERHDGRWQLQPDTTLPGLIDSAVAYDPSRERVVAFGGMVNAQRCSYPYCYLDATWPWDTTYERIGTQWTRRRLPNSPPGRTRAALSPFGSRMILFGGRALDFTSPVDPSSGQTGQPRVPPQNGPLLNDTWSYDGASWTSLAPGAAPPAAEAAQLIQDTRRQRLVLVGGSTGQSFEAFFGSVPTDPFSLWEFDGETWIQRFAPNDASLPSELRVRRGVAAAWHPVRQTVILFGGYVMKMPTCPLTDQQVRDSILTLSNLPYLEANQCIPGFVQDFWEWDGSNLRQLTRASGVFHSSEPSLSKFGVYRQIGDAVPETSNPGAGGANAASALWPWRYDQRPDHFQLRSTLERTYVAPGSAALPAPTTSAGTRPLPGSPPVNPTFVSPTFYPSVRPQMFYDAGLGKLTIVASPDGQVYQTDIATWDAVPPPATPFDRGVNDFSPTVWDSFANRLILFDPRDGTTWQHRVAGWSRLDTTADLDPWLSSSGEALTQRTVHDITNADYLAALWPTMVFDRQRHAAILLHNDKLYELTDATWEPHALPSTMTSCQASRVLAYDGARQRTVLVGCRVPAQTWEWDGSQWFGPFGSPYIATAQREFYGYAPGFGLQTYTGTVQTSFAHQNSFAELPSLGGVGLIDWDGTLRIWNGTAWSAGPKIADGSINSEAKDIIAANGYGTSGLILTGTTTPVALNPPLIEDSAWHRVLTFRGEPFDTMEIKLDAPPASRAWTNTLIGQGSLIEPVRPEPPQYESDMSPGGWYANPWPLEIWSTERFREQTFFDPATAVQENGQPYTQNVPKDVIRLVWPFKLLADTLRQRTLLLSHRGTIWQLGGEAPRGIGDACTTVSDCGDGVACVRGKCSAGNLGDVCDNSRQCANFAAGAFCIDGVCCNTDLCNLACNTCVGSNPGHCEALPAGTPDPRPRTGYDGYRCDGVGCNKVCPGNSLTISNEQIVANDFRPHCIFPPEPRFCGPAESCENGTYQGKGSCETNSRTCLVPSPVACAGGLGCASGTQCRANPGDPGCQTRGDCGPYSTCNTSQVCVPDATSVVVTQRGLTPSPWTPTTRTTPSDLANLLHSAGFERDAAGRIVFEAEFGGVALAFDPNLKTPVTGFRYCLDRIQACFANTHTMDECVAAAPRCVNDLPVDDPGGFDCCPEACLLEYFDRRTTEASAQAIQSLVRGTCYPGMQNYLEGLR